jgi:polyisoprenyl-teichoic acid--peptidoglycan teichoic acid transferase
MAKQDRNREIDEDIIYQQPIKRKKKKKKRKRRLSSQFYWLLLVIASIATFVVLFTAPMFPKKWAFLVLAILLGILVLTGIFTSIFSPRNRIQKFINCFLAICLAVVSILTPYYINKITALFESAVGDKVRINLYVLTDEYKSEHSDIFQNTITLPETDSNGDFKDVDMTNYADAVYGTTISTDSTNQQYAVKQLKELCGKQVQTVDKTTLSEAVQAFYENHSDILIMSESLASTISEIEGFENFETDTKILYSIDRPIDSSASDTIAVDMTTKPFTIFFGGNDTEGELSLEGRTDVDMTVTVNPNTHQIIIVNLPRDSWVQNPYYDNKRDKLTHLGLMGINNTLNGLQNIYGIEISNYVLVNFTTFTTILWAMNGVDIENPYAFTAIDDQYFPEGQIHLDMTQALMYVRERKNLPGGDFDRNMHQQLVMKGIISKLTSADMIVNFNTLLDAISGQFLTNISSDSLYALAEKQLDEGIEWNIVNYHIGGETGMEVCASATGQYLSIVYPYDNQVEFVKSEIQKVISGEIITQEELPEGEITTDYSADHIVISTPTPDYTDYSSDYSDGDYYDDSSDESYSDEQSYEEDSTYEEPVYPEESYDEGESY